MTKRKSAKPTSRHPGRSSKKGAQPVQRKAGGKAKRAPAKESRGRKKPAVLADDIPQRVQAEYRQLLAQGLRERQATSRLTQGWQKALTNKPLREEFLLALAGTQWQLGRLEPAVKKQALAIIDRVVKSPPKKKPIEDEAAAQRRQALASLRGILTSPQPARKAIRQSKAPSSDAEAWPVGEVFAYKLLSGRYVLFHVVACLGDKATGFWPVFAVLDWIGSDPPPAATVHTLPLKPDPHSASESVWMVSAIKRHPSDFSPERIDWLHIDRQPHARNIDRGFAITYWKEKLDEKLRFDFGWE